MTVRGTQRYLFLKKNNKLCEVGTWELWFDSSQYIRHHSSTIDHATSSTLVSSLHTRTEYFLINPRLLSLLLLPNADADPYISTTNFVGHFVALQQQSLHLIAAKIAAIRKKGLSTLSTSFRNYYHHFRPTVGVLFAVTANSTFQQPPRRLNSTTTTFNTNKSCTRANSFSATNIKDDDDQHKQQQQRQIDFHPIYVHHVSRVALEHLQDQCSDWLVERGLDRKLTICQNGTFILRFPEYGRIWTSYDPLQRQHWLSVYSNKLAVRFLLKDHDRAALALQEQQQQQQPKENVQANYASSTLQIQEAVNEMIKAVETIDAKEQAMENDGTTQT